MSGQQQRSEFANGNQITGACAFRVGFFGTDGSLQLLSRQLDCSVRSDNGLRRYCSVNVPVLMKMTDGGKYSRNYSVCFVRRECTVGQYIRNVVLNGFTY